MVGDVNPPDSLRASQVAQTEHRIVAAATLLFLDQGYAATSLAAIAEQAGVSVRTVYVRFGTKAALFKRTVEVAIVGDSDPVAVMDRDWTEAALHAPTLEERVRAWASVARQIMERTGALFEIAQQAAAVEPEIADLAASGRSQSLAAERMFWTRLADDGLLEPTADLEWIIATSSVLDAADTYVFITRLHDWDLATYEAWLADSMLALTRGRPSLPSG